MDDNDRRIIDALGLALGGVLLIALGGALLQHRANNQLVPPIPGPVPPVVEELPRLVSHLQAAKNRGEARCRAAQRFIQARGIQAGVLKGEGLYGDARAEFNGCVTYLVVAVSRRFTSDDPKRIAAALKSADVRLDAFVDWVDSLDRATIGDLPWAELTELLGNLMQWSSEANEKAIDRVVSELNGCRWKTWDELAGRNTGALEPSALTTPNEDFRPPPPAPPRAPAPAAGDDPPELPIVPVRPGPVRRPNG